MIKKLADLQNRRKENLSQRQSKEHLNRDTNLHSRRVLQRETKSTFVTPRLKKSTLKKTQTLYIEKKIGMTF